MPNEKIRHRESGTLIDGSTVSGAAFERVTTATVHWYPEREVLLEIDSSGDRLAYLGPDGKPIGEPFGALAIPLNRDEINRVIKALRRARDSAYGRDE